LGGITLESVERARSLYLSFVKGEIFMTDATSAEMVKLVENTFRDINIAFANELAQICDSLDINVWEIINLANRHPRVNILHPGPGVGGHCIPVDPWFIVEKTPDLAKLINQSRQVNDSMTGYVCKKVLEFLSEIPDPVVSVFGVTYKENVDDIRESPSLDIIHDLRDRGCVVKIHDPYVYPDISIESVVAGSDCILILVNHKEYEGLDPKVISEKMRTKHVFLTKSSSIDSWMLEDYNVMQLGNGKLKVI
jgi:UDP-N-acetyl-D-mannosaminuronic acid dehydrogenase